MPDDRAMIARFFVDLRRALRLTVPQAAYYLQVPTDVVEALETGHVEALPEWHETSAIVMTYAAMAGINARPVLNVLAGLMSDVSRPALPGPREARAVVLTGRNFVRAGSALANGTMRLPQDAIDQLRKRPQRAVYALSLPLLLALMLYGSAFDIVAKPFGSTVRWFSVYFQEHFAPVRDGLRWIEVDDPRTRRADKLRIGGGSY
jgi:hypothetical protein